jgi:capsular exopolysaccharide synthesis family protein
MSRIFDAIRRGTDDISDTILEALADPGQNSLGDSEEGADALLASALQNLPPELTASAPIHVPVQVSPASQPGETAKDFQAGTVRLNRAAVQTVALKVKAHSPLLPFDTANWRASEQYRTVRTRILQDARKPRVIAISSAGVGDGKSVTAINVAGALSLKTESAVVLIDADCRRSSVHTQLSLPAAPGLTDILLDRCKLEDALIRAEQFPNFYILPAGARVENPSDLLESSRWAKLREQISDMFQFTVLDCPPIGTVSEWDLLRAACDGVIIVGRQDHTKLPEFLKAIESIPNEKMIGVLVNCVSDWFLSQPYQAYEYNRPQ